MENTTVSLKLQLWSFAPWANGSATGSMDFPYRYLVSDEMASDLMLFWFLLWLLMIPFGLWTNGLNIRTFLRMGLDESVTISFFTMAVTDFAVLFFSAMAVIAIPLTYLETKFYFHFLVQPMAISQTFILVSGGLATSTLLITAFLAVQRCLCIVKPLHFKSMFPRISTCCFMSLFVFVAILASTLHIAFKVSFEMTVDAFNRTQYVLSTPDYDDELSGVLTAPLYSIGLFACQGLMIVTLIIMNYALNKSAKFRQNSSVTKTMTPRKRGNIQAGNEENDHNIDIQKYKSKERNVITQVSLLSFIFILTTLPANVLCVIPAYVPGIDRTTNMFYNVYLILSNVRMTTTYINASVNIFIYYKYNTKFRKLCFNNRHVKIVN